MNKLIILTACMTVALLQGCERDEYQNDENTRQFWMAKIAAITQPHQESIKHNLRVSGYSEEEIGQFLSNYMKEKEQPASQRD